MNTVDCTGEAFRGIADPYTGEPLRVKMLVTKSSPRFFAPAAYSPCVRYGTAKAAYDAWARKDGIAGARKGREIRCAYTGELLTPMHDETGYWFDGGFDPRRFWSREEFLRYARMRDGESPVPAGPADRVLPARTEPVPLARAAEPGQEALDIAASVAARAGIPRKTAVSMSKGTGKGKRHG